MKLKRNYKLMRTERVENHQALAEQWIASIEGDDPPGWESSFLEDLYPRCSVVALEARLPLPGFGKLYQVHAHLQVDGAVFSLVGEGTSIYAAMVSCVREGVTMTDAEDPDGSHIPF